MRENTKKFKLLYMIFGLLGTALIVATYFLPIWWVSLKGQSAVDRAFKDGIKIVFKYDGVYNGCEGQKEREELATVAGADCLIEMNKINHFIGMYPIVQGKNNIHDVSDNLFVYHDRKTLKHILDLNKNILKQVNDSTLKLTNDTITKIHVTYPIYSSDSIPYDKIPFPLIMLDYIMKYSHFAFIIFVILGLLFTFVSHKKLTWASVLVALAPVYFLIIYIFYLHWYGHNLGLHGGSGINVKPFMPTFFGEGKVEVFNTFSYPTIGFFVGLVGMVLLFLAINFKNKYLASLKAKFN